MPKKLIKTEHQKPIDQKKEDLLVCEQRPEDADKIWDSVFNCNSKQKGSKKVKFKWVY